MREAAEVAKSCVNSKMGWDGELSDGSKVTRRTRENRPTTNTGPARWGAGIHYSWWYGRQGGGWREGAREKWCARYLGVDTNRQLRLAGRSQGCRRRPENRWGQWEQVWNNNQDNKQALRQASIYTAWVFIGAATVGSAVDVWVGERAGGMRQQRVPSPHLLLPRQGGWAS